MGLGMDWVWVGWDLCAGLLYEHRFAMLIMVIVVAIPPDDSTKLIAKRVPFVCLHSHEILKSSKTVKVEPSLASYFDQEEIA